MQVHVEGAPEAVDAQEVERLAITAAAIAGVPAGPGEVTVWFVGAERIAQLNAEHRSVAQATDVLSFPVDGLEPLPAGEPRQLGDVFVCEDYVREQVAAGSSMHPDVDPDAASAVRRCVVHGVLHLAGHDHDSDEAAARMFDLERRALEEA